MEGRRIWAYEKGLLWVSEAEAEPAQVLPTIGAKFAEIGSEKAGELAFAMGLAAQEEVQQRFAAGKRCFVGWVDGAVATYGWVSQAAERIGELEREFRLARGEAYIWDCATLPAYRGQRLYSALLSQLVRTLWQEGVRRVWIGTAETNQPSLRGFTNAGFQPVLGVVYLRLFKLSFFLVRRHPEAPRALFVAAAQAMLRDNELVLGPLALSWS